MGVKNYPVLGNLVYDSEKELQDLLNNFIQKNVFVYEEEGDFKFILLFFLKINGIHTKKYVFFIIIIIMTAGYIIINGG